MASVIGRLYVTVSCCTRSLPLSIIVPNSIVKIRASSPSVFLIDFRQELAVRCASLAAVSATSMRVPLLLLAAASLSLSPSCHGGFSLDEVFGSRGSYVCNSFAAETKDLL